MFKEKGLDCSETLFGKLTTLISIGLAFFLVFYWFNGHIVALAILAYVIIRIPFVSPDVTIYDDGIETSRFGIKHFVGWEDIYKVRLGNFNSQIYPRSIPLIVRFLIYDSLLLYKWRRNYKEAIKIISEQVSKNSS